MSEEGRRDTDVCGYYYMIIHAYDVYTHTSLEIFHCTGSDDTMSCFMTSTYESRSDIEGNYEFACVIATEICYLLRTGISLAYAYMYDSADT
jgi:hypothetical protein